MPNTQAMLAVAVAGFMQRDPVTFIRNVGLSNQFDLLLQACNNARLYAERKIDFELSVTSVTLPVVGLLTGANLNTAVLSSDGITPASVKKIMTPFLPLAGNYQYPIDLWSKRKWNDRLKARYEGAKPYDTIDYAFITESPYVLVQNGAMVFVAPADSSSLGDPFQLFLDAYIWLPNYSTGTETDYILQYCFDWMIYRCMYELNFFLKEDERVSVSEKLMGDSWDAMVKWNDQLVKSAVDEFNLD